MIILQKQQYKPGKWLDLNGGYIYIEMLHRFEFSACIFYKMYNAEYKMQALKSIREEAQKNRMLCNKKRFSEWGAA